MIGIEDERMGQVPKAFVKKSAAAKASGKRDEALADELQDLIKSQKARYKWLRGGTQFVEKIPRTQSNKILRRLLREGHGIAGRANLVAKL